MGRLCPVGSLCYVMFSEVHGFLFLVIEVCELIQVTFCYIFTPMRM